MVFSSLIFIFVFFPLVLLFYFLAKNKWQNIVLLIFSLIFYAWGEPMYIVLMVFSSIVDYINGRMIEKHRDKKIIPKIFLIISIVVNLSLLGYFKYSSFLVDNVNALFNLGIMHKDLRLPIGISFYTFQTMSYSIDVYRSKVKAEKNFLNFMAYVSMFPQLIAGPIVRYETIQHELNHRVIKKENVLNGAIRVLQGLAKKVLLANSIGLLATNIISSDISSLSSMTAWLGAAAFTFQIFFDFSGYSDMAIGMGQIFGFTYPENFNYPYTADSITNFWQRWHMSLSTWFKDYVYIPLGGNRVSVPRNIFNIIIVWSLTGMWHGAAWNFIIWGAYFGIILIIEKFLLKEPLKKSPKFLKHIYTMFLIIVGWVIFMLDTPKDIYMYLGRMFTAEHFIDMDFKFLFTNYIWVFAACVIFSLPIKSYIKFPKGKIANGVYVVFYIVIFLLSIMYIVDNTFNPFLYFRF